MHRIKLVPGRLYISSVQNVLAHSGDMTRNACILCVYIPNNHILVKHGFQISGIKLIGNI